MESFATLRSFNHSIGTIPHVGSLLERPGMVSVQSSCWHGLSKFHKLIASPVKRYRTVVSGAKTSEATVAAKSEVSSGSATQSSLEKNTLRNATFPSAVEALVLEVCDETEVAELKLKVGSFRRNRTVKGKKQPPICKEGDVIKEGQIIGYLDQFGTELPVKSDVAGEVLKLLFNDGAIIGKLCRSGNEALVVT